MPKVDLAFRVTGNEIPADHAYLLYGALCKLLPALHDGPLADEVGVHAINGRLIGDRLLALGPRSRLRLRLDSAHIAQVLPLAGKNLQLGPGNLVIGIPEVYALQPKPALKCRLCIIKGFQNGESFLEAAQRQLDALHVKGAPRLVARKSQRSLEGRQSGNQPRYIRRTLRIRDKEIVGFPLIVEQLSAEESLILQEKGLGGRRHFGCGIFVPKV